MAPGPLEARLQNLAKSVEAEAESLLRQERNSAGITEVVRKLNLVADEEIAQVHARVAEGASRGERKNLDCKPGCAWCCHRVVLATIPEVLSIHSHVDLNFSDQEKKDLDVRLDKYSSNWDRAELAKSRVPCPFLVNDLCSIYEVRPLSCRGMNSVDVSTCVEIEKNPNTASPRASLPAQHALAEAVILGERKALFFEALDPALVDLGQAMHLTRRSITPIDSYLSGRDEFANAKIFLNQDMLLAPDVQRNLHPAYKSELEQVQPSGEPASKDLARVAPFRDLFFGKGEFSKAMKTLRGTSAVELIAKLQIPTAYESEEEIHFWRQHALAALKELAVTKVSPEDAFNVLAMQVPLNMAYQGLDDKDFMKEHSEVLFNKIHTKLFPRLVEPIERRPLHGRRLRVGYLSQHIRYHSGARWVLGWIQNHGDDIESFVLNVGYGEDQYSRRFQQEADHYFFLTRSIPQNARFIKSLNLDVLIMPDAHASPRNLQYSLFRMAPVQCCGWGQAMTTGAPTMDYFISSAMMEPENAQDQYTEKLLLLPNSGVCYPNFKNEPIPNFGRSRFGIAEDKPFLYLAQSAVKCLPQFDYLYKEISDRLDSPIVIHEHRADIGNVVKRRFAKAGIRTHWLPFVSRPEFLRLMQLADVSLDTPIWSGGHTTIEALTFGTPVVTLPGPYMRSRQSQAFLKIAHAEGLIAKDREDYISLASDLDRQQAAVANLNPEALYEDKNCVLALDEFMRRVTSAP